MLKAKELMRISEARNDWKHLKLWSWAHDYEKKAEEWANVFPPVSDDRRVFVNTYRLVYEAIDSLTDNPCYWVCVAVNDKIKEERKMMDGIIARFDAMGK